MHAGAQLPRDAASGARGGCARSSQLPGFYSSSFCLSLLGNNNPQFCSTAARCKSPRAGGDPSGQGAPFLPWGRHRKMMNVFKAKKRWSSWSGSQPQSLVKKLLTSLILFAGWWEGAFSTSLVSEIPPRIVWMWNFVSISADTQRWGCGVCEMLLEGPRCLQAPAALLVLAVFLVPVDSRCPCGSGLAWGGWNNGFN